MGEERYIEIDNFEREFWNLIESSINLKLEGMSTEASSDLNGYISFDARFPTRNKLLKNTSFLFIGSNKLIHFTSLPVLFSIINEGSLRLYNLHNSNDETEYTYASHILRTIYSTQGIPDDRLIKYFERIKEYSFILSCTTPDGIEKSNLWQSYGDKGRGIAIEFEIMNDVNDWEYFYCSMIHYNKLSQFDTLKEGWKNLQTKNPHIKYQIKLNQLLSLQKSKDWEHENEIRILTLYPDDLHQRPFNERILRDFKISKPDHNIRYFKLPLCNDDGKFIETNLENRIEILWKIMPKIRISDIFFGPEFQEYPDFYDFQNDLKHYIAEKMNVWIKSLPKNKVKIK